MASGVNMPWSKVFNFTDPSLYQAAIRASDVEVIPTTKQRFQSELTQVTFDRLWMQRFQDSQPQIRTSQIKPGRKVIFFLTGEQPPFLHRGNELLPRDVAVCNHDVMHMRTESSSRFGSMSLTSDDLDAACKAIAGHEFSGLALKDRVQPSQHLMARLTQLHEMTGQIAKTTPELLELPEVARSLEQKLIHAMVCCLTEGAAFELPLGNRRHDKVVARFEGFLEANPDRPLYLTEICAAIGVAERTLRVACQEHLGMGPIRYLTLRRMHLVRRALLRADASTATVTRLATDHGFWELGRFAVAYRTIFGESPSQSLHRPAEDQRIVRNHYLRRFRN
jgi:AraC-like DNA-binding protein